jgi:hypothetical protein
MAVNRSKREEKEAEDAAKHPLQKVFFLFNNANTN